MRSGRNLVRTASIGSGCCVIAWLAPAANGSTIFDLILIPSGLKLRPENSADLVLAANALGPIRPPVWITFRSSPRLQHLRPNPGAMSGLEPACHDHRQAPQFAHSKLWTASSARVRCGLITSSFKGLRHFGQTSFIKRSKDRVSLL